MKRIFLWVLRNRTGEKQLGERVWKAQIGVFSLPASLHFKFPPA